jgi:penicillin-binding protein 1A
VCLTAFAFGLITAIASELPSLDPARAHQQEVDGVIYAGNPPGRVLAVLRGSQSRVIVPSDRIAPLMKLAIVSVEDKRFYEHRAIDLRGMVRAFIADITHQGVVQGGSTITQQLIKNTYLHDEKSFGRKIKEAALAWQLEHNRHWTKDRILTAYLNTIYFGNGAYGVQQAAMTYFGHGASALTLAESALLAGIPSDPSLYDPVTNPRAARARRGIVLADLFRQGYITKRQYVVANRAPLPKPDDVHLPGDEGPAQYFTNYVKQQLIQKYGAGHVFGGGLRVRTTIDLGLQQIARDSIARVLRDPNAPSAALVAIDPKNGSVLAMVGGRNYRRSQFNLAVQGERQPGSSFKPFVLATALKDGVSPQTTFVSEPTKIVADGRVWDVHNYEDSYLGTISLETATTESDNAVYAQLTRLVGPAAIRSTAKSLGITSPLQTYYAIGLGAEAVNPLEMARAYSAFANGGYRIDGTAFGNTPRAIQWVKSAGYRMVDDNRPLPRRRLSPNTAAMVDQLLSNVIRSGTGVRAQLSDGRDEAGKTGTTENYGDAWFVGYTPNLVTAIWVGYPNKLIPMTTQFNGQPVAGGTYPALIWKTFMERALRHLNKPADSFPAPVYPYASATDVVLRDGRLRLDNGHCHNVERVLMFSGSSAGSAPCKPNEVDVPRVVGWKVRDAVAKVKSQPLTPRYAFRPALPLQRLGVVVGQIPASGTLSSYDDMTLVLPKATHGVVPDVVGLPLRAAQARIAARGLAVTVTSGDGPAGRVVSQTPAAGVASGPRVALRLVVGRG